MEDRGPKQSSISVSDIEHLGNLTLGALLLAWGSSRKGPKAFLLSGLGGGLIYRGLEGYRRLYDWLGIEYPAQPVRLAKRALKVQKSIYIDKDPQSLYSWWRNLSNLPKAMNHLVSVTEGPDGLSHWVAKAPAGTVIEWDAEIENDIPGKLISWRSFEGSDLDNAGTVEFKPSGNGTELRITLRYLPPGDVVGAALARLVGSDPANELEEDLHRFKKEVEMKALI